MKNKGIFELDFRYIPSLISKIGVTGSKIPLHSEAFCYRDFMTSFEQFKKALGKKGRTLSDEQIGSVLDLFEKSADNLFNRWKNEKKKQKSVVTVYNKSTVKV